MKKQSVLKTLVLLLCGGLLSCSTGTLREAKFEIIPLPQKIEAVAGESFVLNGKTAIVYPEGNEALKRNAGFLAEYIRQASGKQLKLASGQAASNTIVLNTDLQSDNIEAYQMEVGQDAIIISGASEAGVFYGIQTLRKSIPTEGKGDIAFPAVKIDDYPRFAYRGTHLDVSRHFFPVDSVKRYIDILALHNINRFHWHLTDDQGWRIEIKKRPELTTVGSMRSETVIGRNTGQYDNTPYGGFYTQDEAKDIVRYAQERYITVIPEIDLPGHMQAALAAYPELGCTGGPYEVWKIWGVSEDVLCAGNDKTLDFIRDVLEEIVEIFPSEYIHVGGDECPKVRWEECSKCQAKIKELGLKADKKHTAEQRLQSYIINYAEKVLNEKGRQIIGWEEILEGGLAPNATVMSWTGIAGGIEAVRQKHKAIMTPNAFLYFDYYQSTDTDNEPFAIGGYVPVEKVYSYEPVPEEISAEEAHYIIGVQANLWTEYIPIFSHVEYMLLPRIAALSEVQWTMPDKKDYPDFLERLPRLISLYESQGYNYACHVFDVKAEYIPDTGKNVLNVVLNTIGDSPIHYTLDGSEPASGSNVYEDTLRIDQSCVLKAVTFRSGKAGRQLKEEIRLNKASLKPVRVLKPINEKYRFGGENTLIDGLKGGNGYRTGRWIGFYRNDMELMVDLQQEVEFSKAWVRNYVEIAEEILDLRKFSVSVSDDGAIFREIKSENYPAATVSKKDNNGIFTHELSFDAVKARYVLLSASPEYTIPDWHWGKGRPAFIFVDEIGLE